MPRKTKSPRKAAGKSPVARPNRRAVAPKQARAPSGLERHGRGAQAARPMKFPGRQGGR
ncbi:hypothetical protein L0664_01450 [Octadecabacter sp. G9-8]|uniref:Uncharacterized protein n=1 Tax=Octadecabacter dasysiphoniae TaxID=2909341 RepID=A0ABS9CR58_9RHOB|nr:hypothetical protein [Octadecabacter dasysiphoniae]MCF2869719.1 hypothetical protein [Octadecabacter dasysiphoniae]